MRKILHIITAILIIAGVCNAAFEDKPVARPAGLGEAFTAMTGDASSIFYNPAGIAVLKNTEISLSYSRSFVGLNYDGLNNGLGAFVMPLGEYGVLGAGYLLFSSDLYRESTISFSYAYYFNELPLSLGITGKLLGINYVENDYTKIDSLFILKGNSKSVFDIELGCLLELIKGMRIGVVLENALQPDISLAGDGAKLPMKIRAGIAYELGNITPTVDVTYTTEKTVINGGIEYWDDSKTLGIRCGGSINEAAIGLSYILGEIGIDYAFLYPINSITGTYGSHLISLGWKFR